MERKTYTPTCPECSRPFTTDSPVKKTCSQACAKNRQRKQLERLAERRKASRKSSPRPCDVCGTVFLPSSRRNIYCSPLCRAEGLLRCIEGQRRRREAEKRATEEIVKTKGQPLSE